MWTELVLEVFTASLIYKNISGTGKSRNEKEYQPWLLYANISTWGRRKIHSWILERLLQC